MFIYLGMTTARIVGDFGPVYFETLPGRFPVEPFNTFSNLVFLLLVLLFAFRTRLNSRRYPATVLALPVLLTGFVGGSLYHATRSNNIWLFLDFIPIAVLVMLACIHFWYRMTGRLSVAALLSLLPFIVLRWMLTLLELPLSLRISSSYVIMAFCIVLPAFLVCARNRGRDLWLLILAIFSFAAAVFFRVADSLPSVTAHFPMGTHFLWHILGGISTGLLLEFLYRDESAEGETEIEIQTDGSPVST